MHAAAGFFQPLSMSYASVRSHPRTNRMNKRKKAVFNWSGGNDSALTLQKILQDNEFEVISLLSTINEETLKSSIHSIPIEILTRQADSIGIPLYKVLFAKDLANYDDKMKETTDYFKKQGVTHFIFGDIFGRHKILQRK